MLSTVILLCDKSYHADVRSVFDQILYKFTLVTNSPLRAYEFLAENLQSRSKLIAENNSLKLDMMVMQAKMHELFNASEENKVLKQLLSSSSTINSEFAVAMVVAQHVDSVKRYLVIDKGTLDGAYVGQAVVDTKGVVGYIVESEKSSSKVLLITDKNNAIPVQNSAGNRAIVAGGQQDYLSMLDITETNNFAVGQKLYTSGLGSRYMQGYPVGVISEMNSVSGKNFMEVKVKPFANIYEAKYLLLVWIGDKNE